MARAYARDGDAADDIVQETFIRVSRGLDRFDDRTPFRPWFYTIVRNVARTHARAEARWVSFDDEHESGVRAEVAQWSEPGDDSLQLPHAIDRSEFRALVEAELARMTRLQSVTFRLCEIDGFTAAEAADMLGIAPVTVRVHRHRARIKLRDMLTKHGYRREA